MIVGQACRPRGAETFCLVFDCFFSTPRTCVRLEASSLELRPPGPPPPRLRSPPCRARELRGPTRKTGWRSQGIPLPACSPPARAGQAEPCLMNNSIAPAHPSHHPSSQIRMNFFSLKKTFSSTRAIAQARRNERPGSDRARASWRFGRRVGQAESGGWVGGRARGWGGADRVWVSGSICEAVVV